MAWLAALLVTAGCSERVQHATDVPLRLDPDQVFFGVTWADGAVLTRTFQVVNDGRTTVEVSWDLPGAPFAFPDVPNAVPPGATTVSVKLDTSTAGHYSRRFTLHEVGLPDLAGTVDATAKPLPQCVPSSPCVSTRFDELQGACVETTLPDGQTCDSGSLCVLNATCQAGRCVGTEKVCNDGNKCTTDVCNAATGCEFLPAPPCPGDGVCQVGVCHPDTGCGFAPAPDGLACGPLQTCVAADVCINGQCVVRDPPDGYVCGEASPCQPEARCQQDQCVRQGPRTSLVPTWSFDSQASGSIDAGTAATFYSDLVLEPTGALSLGNFFQSPMRVRANTAGARDAPDGASRRCILWNGRYVCADYPSTPNGRVSAMDLATGALVWSFNIHNARPDFAAKTDQIFLARLVVQGSDRLAALYEAYPKAANGNPGTLCRLYFLIVMNGAGDLVQGQEIHDPLLDVCNHPHPYGVAADSVGNLFIAFSPSKNPQAPLIPDRPMLLVSFTHDGVFRWKLTDFTMNGGELAVARGLLYPENSDVVLFAATGLPAFQLPEVGGRVVVSDARLITAPTPGGSTLSGYEAGTATRRWQHVLPFGMSFWSEPLRLASWHTSKGDKTVALTFVQQGDVTSFQPTPALRGIDVNDGREAFTCPLDLGATRSGPQLFEVANGSLGVMEGAFTGAGQPGCSKCDPPFAGTAGRFFSLPTPGLSVAAEPWLGTFGGAGHDHQEEILPTPTGPSAPN